MKTKLALLMLLVSAVFAVFADSAPDLTGAGPDSFKAHLGKTVTLRGRLEEGKEGHCLFGATPTNVVFYIIPDMPPKGIYIYPASWEHLMHRQVQVTGELKFRGFEGTRRDPKIQIPPDYYYLVLQHATIEGLDTK